MRNKKLATILFLLILAISLAAILLFANPFEQNSSEDTFRRYGGTLDFLGYEVDFDDPEAEEMHLANRESLIVQGAGGQREIYVVYDMYDKNTDQKIDIDPENAEVFIQYEDGGEVYANQLVDFFAINPMPSDRDGEYEFAIFRNDEGEYSSLPAPYGTHKFIVHVNDGRKYKLEMEINESVSIEPVLVEDMQEDATVFRLGDLDISDFDAMYHIHPDDSSRSLQPRGDSFLKLSAENIQEGEHIFLIHKNNIWHHVSINNPEDF